MLGVKPDLRNALAVMWDQWVNCRRVPLYYVYAFDDTMLYL